MRLLQGAIRQYRWGSPTAICDLIGTEPSGEPVAELWLGAHPSAPAQVDGTALDALIAADLHAELGADIARRYGALPFLLKVLSAAEPLSLQAHPSQAQAEAGFAAENAQGVKLDSPARTFRDRSGKPELICALTEFSALSGFRDPSATVDLLETVHAAARDASATADADAADDGLAALEQILGLLRAEPNAAGLRRSLALLLSIDDAIGLVAAVTQACETLADGGARARGQPSKRRARDQRARDRPGQDHTKDRAGHDELCREVAALGERYPEDPAVAAALLMNLLRLQPGEALYLGPGTLHCYLRGTALEVMAGSDNVVRGGLTSKHIDIEKLLEIADAQPCEPPVQRPDAAGGSGACEGMTSYRAPVHEFSLDRISTERCDVAVGGPAILLCTSGTATVTPAQPPVDTPRVAALARGQAAWLSASDSPVRLSGRATVFRAGVGSG